MIIYLDKSIEQHYKNEGFNEDEILFLSELAISHRKGYCFLCGHLDTIETIKDLLGDKYSFVYNQIKNSNFTVRSIIEKVEKVLVVSYNEKIDLPEFICSKAILLNMKDALEFKLNLQCTLLAENISDCKFYELIGKRFMAQEKIKGLDLSFHEESGGGNTTDKNFVKCVKEDKSLVLCIVDSDVKYGPTKKFPNNPGKGDTAKLLERAKSKLEKELNIHLYELFCLPVHEVENLIPISILKSLSEDEFECISDGVAFLEKLVQKNCGQAVLLYDFKCGGTKFKSEPCKEYWNNIGNCISDTTFPQLCDRLLEHSMKILNDTYDKVTLEIPIKDLWNSIGLKVFSWGCANKPIRV